MKRPRILPLSITVLVLASVLLIIFWDWNWFKPLAEWQASVALGRKVVMGHFDLRLLHKPAVIVDNLSVANPPDFPRNQPMAGARRVEVQVDPGALLEGKIVLPAIALDQPRGDLLRLLSGRANWLLAHQPAAGGATGGGTMPTIGALDVSGGDIRYQDAKLHADFVTRVHTVAGPGGDGRIVADTKGTYAGKPITAHFVGGSVLNLRDPSKPYPVDLTAANGATTVTLKGTVENPTALGGANLVLTLKGNDLADLFPLTNIPFPPTPAYQLRGNLDYARGAIRFRDFSGVVGSSDLEGTIAVEPRAGTKPLVTANLTSNRVVLADLAGFIGGAPGKPGTANDTPEQKALRAHQAANPKLLPDTPISLPKLRAADLDVTYVGKRIESQATPLDNLSAHLTVTDGKLALKPLSFGVGTGQIRGDIALDGQRDLVHAAADIDFRKVDVSRLMQSSSGGVFHGAGTIGGRAAIDGTGNSLAAIVGHGNGELLLFMKGGDLSALLVDLAGLDLGNSVLSAIGLPSRAPVRCMVGSFGLDQGVVKTKLFVVDTTEANIVGKGTIDLRGNESIDYQISTQPKHFSVGSFAAPIDIRGPLKSPSVMPDPKALAIRGGAAAILGVLLTPLGALLPTIQLGLGEDNNCGELVGHTATQANRLKARPVAAVRGG